MAPCGPLTPVHPLSLSVHGPTAHRRRSVAHFNNPSSPPDRTVHSDRHIVTTVDRPGSVPTTRRRVRRIVRKLDPWTVLKVALVFAAIAAIAFVLLSIIGWAIFNNLGIPERINAAAEQVQLIDPGDSLLKSGDQYFRAVVFLSVSWMIMSAGVVTLGSILYNLIAEMVGGLEFTVIEEVPIDMEQVEFEPAGNDGGRP